jgi:hypothetical protein
MRGGCGPGSTAVSRLLLACLAERPGFPGPTGCPRLPLQLLSRRPADRPLDPARRGHSPLGRHCCLPAPPGHSALDPDLAGGNGRPAPGPALPGRAPHLLLHPAQAGPGATEGGRREAPPDSGPDTGPGAPVELQLPQWPRGHGPHLVRASLSAGSNGGPPPATASGASGLLPVRCAGHGAGQRLYGCSLAQRRARQLRAERPLPGAGSALLPTVARSGRGDYPFVRARCAAP